MGEGGEGCGCSHGDEMQDKSKSTEQKDKDTSMQTEGMKEGKESKEGENTGSGPSCAGTAK